MTFGCHVGSFTKSVTTSGFPFNQDITSASITGTPILVICWSSFTTADAAYQDTTDTGFTFGFATAGATAGKMHSAGMFEDDGAASSTSWRWLVNNSATAWMRRYSPAGVLGSEFHLNSFLSNGFRITYNATNDARADIYNYLVVWGTDWTVNSGTFNARTTVGSDTIAHGLGAAAKFVMQISGQRSADNDNGASGGLSIGMASSTTVANQRCMAQAVENGRVTMDTWRYMPVDSALGILDSTTGSVDGLCTVSTMDATNFVDNWSDACSAAWRISWLAIAGGTHDVHNMSAPASIGNSSKTGLSYQPVAIFAFTRGATATTTSDAHARIAAGAGKSSSIMRGALYGSEDNTANCEALVRSSSAYIIETNPADIAATASSTLAPQMQIKISTMNSDGYTLTYDATSSAFITSVWALAGTTSVAYSGTVNETVNVTEQVQRNIAVNRPVSQSVAVSEAISKGIGRSVAESVAISEASITRQLGANRVADEDVAITEQVSRSGSFNSGVSDTPVNISEDITRNITVTRPVTESVTVSEVITSSVGYNRVVNETVTILGENEFNLDEFNIDEFGAPGYEKVRAVASLDRTVNESVAVSEQVTSNFGKSVVVSESVAVSESITKQAGYQRAMSESIAVSEIITGGNSKSYFRVVDENVTISENFTVALPRIRGRARRIGTSNKSSRIEVSRYRAENIES